MFLLREATLVMILIATCHGVTQQFKKKAAEGLNREVETYSYPVPTETFEENQGNKKSKVIVETIKSISPSEYITSTGYLGSTIEDSTDNGKVSFGTVSYNTFEPETTKKVTTLGFINSETSTPDKTKSSRRHYTGSSSSPNPINSPALISSTVPPAPVRTTNFEPAPTLLSGYHYPLHSSKFPQSSASGEITATEKSLKIITTRGKASTGRYTLQRTIKKPTKVDSKVTDSKPEETGFNGYHYDVGSLDFETKHSASQGGGGMMGASYMRSSSPYYNYHVMLD